MAYDLNLANRIRERIANLPLKIEEKEMFSGIVFMVDDKMCINVSHDDMMCRIDPEKVEEALEKRGCSLMVMKGKELKNYILVSEEGMRSQNDFNYFIALALEFNKKAKSSKKKKS